MDYAELATLGCMLASLGIQGILLALIASSTHYSVSLVHAISIVLLLAGALLMRPLCKIARIVTSPDKNH